MLTLTSTDFSEGDKLDTKHILSENYGFGCAGGNQLPELNWSGVPDNTVELALTVFDPDAPTGSGFWHWLLVNIDVEATSMTPNVISNSLQVQNDFGAYDYGGPCPPEGHGPHHYLFTLSALHTSIEATADTPAAQIGFQLHFKTIEKSVLTGIFER